MNQAEAKSLDWRERTARAEECARHEMRAICLAVLDLVWQRKIADA